MDGSATVSASACFRKVVPMKSGGAGCEKRPGFFPVHATSSAKEFGRLSAFVFAESWKKTSFAPPQGASNPSTGTVKSVRMVGTFSKSTKAQLGNRSAQLGAKSRSCRFMAAKFSPLIQIRSIAPPASRPAAFSATTVATALAVSSNFTWVSVTP